MPHEVVNIVLDSIFTREDNVNQQREFNFVFKVDTIHPETGEAQFTGEYRTIASDTPLNLDEAKQMMQDLIEKEYG